MYVGTYETCGLSLFSGFQERKAFIFPYVYHRSLFFVSPYMFLLFFLFFFSGGGGQALLGERVKGQISRVIPAMVTSKWDWRQSSQSKNRTSYKPYTSPIFGKTSQSKGYLRLRSRNLVFFSPCLFFFLISFEKVTDPVFTRVLTVFFQKWFENGWQLTYHSQDFE